MFLTFSFYSYFSFFGYFHFWLWQKNVGMFKGKFCCRCSCRGQPSTLEEREKNICQEWRNMIQKRKKLSWHNGLGSWWWLRIAIWLSSLWKYFTSPSEWQALPYKLSGLLSSSCSQRRSLKMGTGEQCSGEKLSKLI